MKKTKKRTLITVLSVALIFTLAIGAVAAVYLLQQAKVTVFNGRLGFVEGEVIETDQSIDEKQAELVIESGGIEVGHEASLTDGDDIIPVISDVSSRYIDYDSYSWESRNGEKAFIANNFMLTAKNGDLFNLSYDINVEGNPSIESALRFGFVVKRDDGSTQIFTSSINGVALPEIIGDGNIEEGEKIQVEVSVWADAYALAYLGRFDDMPFGIDIIFTADNQV